jgi:Tfp pilus assembly protein PilO
MKSPGWFWFLLPLAVLLWSAQGLIASISQYRRAQAETRALEREIEAKSQALPQSLREAPIKAEDLPLLYESLLRLAERQGLQIERLEPGEASDANGVQAWAIRLDLEGTYTAVLGYLEELPQIGQALWVEAYSLQPVEGSQGKRLRLELSLRALAP